MLWVLSTTRTTRDLGTGTCGTIRLFCSGDGEWSNQFIQWQRVCIYGDVVWVWYCQKPLSWPDDHGTHVPQIDIEPHHLGWWHEVQPRRDNPYNVNLTSYERTKAASRSHNECVIEMTPKIDVTEVRLAHGFQPGESTPDDWEQSGEVLVVPAEVLLGRVDGYVVRNEIARDAVLGGCYLLHSCVFSKVEALKRCNNSRCGHSKVWMKYIHMNEHRQYQFVSKCTPIYILHSLMMAVPILPWIPLIHCTYCTTSSHKI